MSLSEEQIIDLFNEACRETFSGLERFRHFARAIEAAVRKQDDALIRQLVEDICGAKLCERNSMSGRMEMLRLMDKAITAGRARLEGKP